MSLQKICFTNNHRIYVPRCFALFAVHLHFQGPKGNVLQYLIIFNQLVAYADHYSYVKYLPKNLNKLNRITKI